MNMNRMITASCLVLSACASDNIKGGSAKCASTKEVAASLMDPENVGDVVKINEIGAVIETSEVDKKSVYADKRIATEANYKRYSSANISLEKDSEGSFVVRGSGQNSLQEIILASAHVVKIHVSLGSAGYLSLDAEQSPGVQKLKTMWEELYPVTDAIEASPMQMLRVFMHDYAFSDSLHMTSRVSHRGNSPDQWKSDQVWLCSDEKASERKPNPASCLSPVYRDTWELKIAKSSVDAYRSEIEDLVRVSEEIKLRRGSRVSPAERTTLSELENLHRKASAYSLKDKNLQGLVYFLSADECTFGCGNKPLVVRTFAKHVMPERMNEVEQIIASGFDKSIVNALEETRINTTAKVRNEAITGLLSVYRLVSQSIEKYKNLLSIESHHLNSYEVKPGNVSYRSVPLFAPSKPKELEGITPKIDQGRLLLEFSPEAKNLTNEIHNGSIVTLDGFPITVYLLNQKQSDASVVFPLPAVKRRPGLSRHNTPQAPETKPEPKKAPEGDSKPDSNTCAV